jgi:hypothetical protein
VDPTTDVLATQPGSVMEIALMNDTLFFRGASIVNGKFDLVALAKDGGASRAIAEAQGIKTFAVDDMHRIGATAELFYTSSGAGILGGDVPEDGSAAVLLYVYGVSTESGYSMLAMDDDWLYVPGGVGGVARIAKNAHGSPGQVIANEEYPSAIRVDADFVYWLSSDPHGGDRLKSLRKARKSDGPAVTLATDDGFLDREEAGLRLAMDDEALYFGDRKNHKIAKYPKSGGDPVVLVEGTDADWVLGLVVDGGNAYWINGASGPRTLNRVSTSGGAVERIATFEASAYGLVHEGKTFYYTTNSAPGAVTRVSCK